MLVFRPVRVVLSLIFLFSVVALAAQGPSPGYSSPWRHQDGSQKLALYFAGGINPVLGNTRASQNHGWNFRMGGGYRFNQRYAALLEYGYDHFQTPQPVVTSLFLTPTYEGKVHLWSIGVQPTMELVHSSRFGLYATGGVGFYRKKTKFQYVPPPCNRSLTDCTVAVPSISRSNNAPGFNGGAGIAWRWSEFGPVKIFLEARYVRVANKANANSTFYLPANQTTEYIPILAGFRW